MEELARTVGRERVQLEYLLFKVLVLQHQLNIGDDRFLRWAMEEVSRAGQRLRATELERVNKVRELSLAAGIAKPDLTLGMVAEQSPEPWRTIFTDHNLGFRRLLAELDSALLLTSVLADASGHAVADILRRAYRPAAHMISLPRDSSERYTELA